MSMRSWIRSVFARPVTRPIRRAPDRRLVLEPLEAREVPATFTVNTLADTVDSNSVVTSLREAITAANSVAGDDTINFSVTGTINLTGALPDLDSNLAVQGPGAARLTVRRDTGGDYRIFSVPGGRTVALSGLTVTGGQAPSGTGFAVGGGIANGGTLTVTDSVIANNAAAALNGSGGGIYNAGTLTVASSTLAGNTANGDSGGTATIGAAGGGIANAGTLTVTNSTLSGNSATGKASSRSWGGGIYNDGTLTVTNGTLSGNTATGSPAGGGIYTHLHTLTLNNSLVVNSSGGGDIFGTFTGSHNLFGTLSLTPLEFNGGPTQTHVPIAGSAAINAGDNALIPSGAATDQRGFARIIGGTVDIGAVEFDPNQPTVARAQAAVTGYEGSAATNTGTFNDAQGRDTVTLTASLGTVTKNDATGTWGWSYTPHDDPVGFNSPITVTVTAADGSGLFASSTFTLTVANVDPTITSVTVPAGGNVGSPVNLSATATDPAGANDPLNYIWTITQPDNFSFMIFGPSASFTPSDVGHYGVRLVVTDGDGGGTQIATEGVEVTHVALIATTSAVTTSAASSTYGDAVTFTAAVTGESTPTGTVDFVIDGGTPVAGVAGSTPGTWTYTTATLSAGTHTVQALFDGSGGFVDSNATLSGGQTVDKATATVAVGGYTGGPYDGSAHTRTVTVTGVSGDGQLYTTSLAGTNAGSYSQPWSYSNANYSPLGGTLAFAIAKANAAVTVTPYAVTYDGSSHTATVASIAGVNGETGAAVGSVALNTTHTNAGTYSDSWSFAGGANYNDIASTAITNVVNKAASAVVVTIHGGPFTYNGRAQTPAAVSVTGVGGLSLTPTASYANNVNAGTATAGYSYAGDANHEAGSGSATFTIAKANATVVVTPYTVTYDGQAHTATVSSITGVNGETVSAVGTVSLGTAHANAGTYSDSWSFSGSANYNDIASTTITNTINKAALTITANDDTKAYGTAKTFSSIAFTQTGLVTGDAIAGVTATSVGAAVSAAVGTYAIVPSAATGTGLGNYDISYVSGTLTVFPALTVPGAQTAYEDVDKAISGISIASGLSGSLTLTLGVGHGTLTLGTTTGLTVTGNGTGSVTLVGGTADLNAALAALVYTGSLNFSGADTLSLTVVGGSFSSTASTAVTVLSAAQQAADLEAEVNAMVTSGVLAGGQGEALLLNLRDNNGDAGKVSAFLNQVAAFLQGGILTQAQADALLGPGDLLLLSVSRR